MICMDVADKDALEISQSFPGIRGSRSTYTEVPNELAPSTFTSIEEEITPTWYLYESARNCYKIVVSIELLNGLDGPTIAVFGRASAACS
jgi:hypothetical protein